MAAGQRSWAHGGSFQLAPIVLSPIALTVRDQATPAVEPRDSARVQAVCNEVLEANTIAIQLGSPEMKAVVASVVEGVLAALATSRADVLERVMHAIARFASTREHAEATLVASVICDAASVIEVSDTDRQSYLVSMIDAVLAACDHLLRSEREELATFLRNALPAFLAKRSADTRPEVGQPGPGSA